MDPSSSSSSNKRKRDLDCYDEPRYKRPKFDVFVNYAPGDIGNGFASHLKGALGREGFTICDHNKLPNGLDKSSELLKSIEDSEIYLVVFSPKYASYKECLDEFALIMQTYPKFKKRKVFPIFFDVDPSHVRNQQGSFLEAFQGYKKNVDPERVQTWWQTLKGAGDKSGLNLKDCRDEEKLIRKIMKDVRKMKNPQQLCNIEHPVGIESRAQDVISALRSSSIVAVLGISGSGKTAVVKAVYDKISADFDVSCFIQDINSYVYRGPNWIVDLQKDVISCLTGNDKCVAHHNDGAAKIKKLISGQKFFLVLDDVYTSQQLQALSIDHSASFHCGSKIIVTTRNTQSLSNLQHSSYNIELLDTRESFELFTRLIGKGDPMDKKFVDAIVRCAGGIPLVIEVWSRHFTDYERTLWPSMLETLKRIPHEDTQKKLRISYDSLPKRAKNLFLDIACFFNRMTEDLIVKVLEDEYFPDVEIQIQNLVHRSLLKNDSWRPGAVSLHDVIREMGQEVVRQEDEDEPGKRTRLMGYRDVVRVLGDCSGTDSVRSIRLGCRDQMDEANVEFEAFKKMSNLRFIQWDYNDKMQEEAIVQLESFKKMSNLRFIKLDNPNLRWSCSSNEDDMSACFSFKHLKYLEWYQFPCKSLDNIHMGNVVVIILNFSKLEKLWEGANKKFRKLEILDVSWSRSLIKTGNFIGLENLEELNLENCCNLEEIDSSIGCLQKLVELNLINCKNLVNLSSSISKLQSLKKLKLDNCLKLGSEGLTQVTGLRNLQELYMRNCNVSQVSSGIGNLVSLKYLDLDGNPFSCLPEETFSNLSQLKRLCIRYCDQLQFLPPLPLMNAEGLYIGLSGEELPEWCTYRYNSGKVLSFVAPIKFDHSKICGLILCVIRDEIDCDGWVYPTIYNKTKGTSHWLQDTGDAGSTMVVIVYPLNDTTLVVEAGETVEIRFDNDNDVRYKFIVKSSGLRMVYDDDVVDLGLVLRDVRNFPLPLSSEIMTGNSITQLNDEEICPFLVPDDEYPSYNLSPWYLDLEQFVMQGMSLSS